MTRITPDLLMILHLLHIFFTEGLTFIVYPFHLFFSLHLKMLSQCLRHFNKILKEKSNNKHYSLITFVKK